MCASCFCLKKIMIIVSLGVLFLVHVAARIKCFVVPLCSVLVVSSVEIIDTPTKSTKNDVDTYLTCIFRLILRGAV